MLARRTAAACVPAALPGWVGPYALVLSIGFLCYLALGAVLPALPRIVLGDQRAGAVVLGLAVGGAEPHGGRGAPLGGWLARCRRRPPRRDLRSAW